VYRLPNLSISWKIKLKTNTKNLHEPVDKQHYKKKYLLRVVEHEEAEEEIRNAKTTNPSPSNDGRTQMSDMQRMDQAQIYKQ